jgi:NADH-quinone oxidoreductase subunit G
MKIDGREIAVSRGMTIMDACRKLGIYIPHFCYHPALSIAGSCRLCLVEVKDMPKPAISCNMPADDKFEVFTNSETVVKAREAMMEFFLLNHPLECPVCDQAGECDLQDFSFKYGRGYSRYEEGKEPRPKKDVGRDILLYTQRCVLCTRCTRFLDEVSGTSELTVVNRGFHTEIDVAPGKRVDNLLAGNVTDICPVGALESKDFLFKSRVWYLKTAPSVCPHCPTGCNLNVQTKGNRILRVKPRPNVEHLGPVNGWFICDIGRYGYKYVNDPRRLTGASRRTRAASAGDGRPRAVESIDDALAVLASRLREAGGGGAAAVASPWMTNEEAWLLATIFKERLAGAPVALLSKKDRPDDVRFKSGFTVHADTAPNARGVTEVLTAALGGPPAPLEEIHAAARDGRLKSLLVFNGNPDPAGTSPDLDALGSVPFLAVADLFPGPLAALAHFTLPVAATAEKEGTFTSRSGRVQRLSPAVAPPGQAQSEWRLLMELYRHLGGEPTFRSPAETFAHLAARVPAYSGMTYDSLGGTGLPVRPAAECTKPGAPPAVAG